MTKKINDINFLVVDVETTGSKKELDRIIDIAYVVVNKGQIVEEFSSLINPERFVPPLITKITGIHNEDVFPAPFAGKVLKRFRQIFGLKNIVFVAHFAKFDYSFINASFLRAGMPEMNFQVLDTLKLAQKILPNDVKKNVGSMASYFGVPVIDRHRALGDAKATAYSLIKILDFLQYRYLMEDIDEVLNFQDNASYPIQKNNAKSDYLKHLLTSLPEKPGVYYFKNEDDEIIYIGKAKDLKSRISSFFKRSSMVSKNLINMMSEIKDISWIETKSELSAVIKENSEIKQYNPLYNHLRKKENISTYLKITKEHYPRIIRCNKIEDDGEYIGPFTNRFLVDDIAMNIQKNFKIRVCEENISTEDMKNCLYFNMGRCLGSCLPMINEQQYFEELGKVKQYIYSGVKSELKSRMNELSNIMEFETAAVIRNQLYDLQRALNGDNVSHNAMTNENYIAITPHRGNETLIMIFIRGNLLVKEEFISTETDSDYIKDIISKAFFTTNHEFNDYTEKEIEEAKIVEFWMSKNVDEMFIVKINNKKDVTEIEYDCLTYIENYFIK